MHDMPHNARAGRYVRQSNGCRAFIPVDLPPVPPIKLEGDLQRRLSRADRALGRLVGSVETLPDPDLFVFMYVRKEAVLSSQIEGTQSSLDDLLAIEADWAAGRRLPQDVFEVVNYVAALKHGLARLPELPVSVRLITEIHEKLLEGVRGHTRTPGQIRTTQNWIGPAGCGLADATFVPPPPTLVREALGNLERFIHEGDQLPLLIRIGLIHSQFETIHPFLDGNGRVGRLLITFLLTEREVLRKPVLYLSHYFRQHRQRYYDLLQSVRDHGDWEGWLGFFLDGVAEVSLEATQTAQRILRMRERHREQIASVLGRAAGNGHKLLESLFVRPIVSVTDVQETIGTTFPPANNLVSKMVDLGILHELTGFARNRRFRYEPYIRLFREGRTDTTDS